MPLTGDRRQPLLVILGPTAVGKTDLALRLAQQFSGGILGADSRQIYRQMDIGTAKPTAEQRAAVPHWLIDIADPEQPFSLADYLRHANAATAEAAAAGLLPILCGGTGQYITALLEGWMPPEVPPLPALRAALEAEAADRGVSVLYARLIDRDPAAGALIDPHNLRRIIRALEVIEATGRPFSQQRRRTPPSFRTRIIGLTMDRDALCRRADLRLEAMIDSGFLDEVRALLERGCSPALPSMSAVGYRELAAHLLEGLPLGAAVDRAKTATHAFIRRQFSWFRGHDRGILWHNMESWGAQEQMRLIDQTAAWLDGRSP